MTTASSLNNASFQRAQQPALTSLALPVWPLCLLLAASTMACVYSGFVLGQLPDTARIFTVALDLLACAMAVLVLPRVVEIGLTGALLPFLIAWRVGAMHNSVPVMAVSGVTGAYFVLLFLATLRKGWAGASSWHQRMEWQMTLLRVYFGFDMVGHFAEKLFAGSGSFAHMAHQFESFGLPNGALFVIVGGLCELGVAIGIGMGFLTRLAGVGGALYFMIANHYGAHFANGFTWSNGPDDGWEYPLLMTLFYLSFSLSGAGRFSVDGWLLERGLMPRWARPLAIALPASEA